MLSANDPLERRGANKASTVNREKKVRTPYSSSRINKTKKFQQTDPTVKSADFIGKKRTDSDKDKNSTSITGIKKIISPVRRGAIPEIKFTKNHPDDASRRERVLEIK